MANPLACSSTQGPLLPLLTKLLLARLESHCSQRGLLRVLPIACGEKLVLARLTILELVISKYHLQNSARLRCLTSRCDRVTRESAGSWEWILSTSVMPSSISTA